MSPDHLMQTLSWFLVGRADANQVEEAIAQTRDLGSESAELVDELRVELSAGDVAPPKLQPLVREAIEAIAHGD